MSAIRKYRRCPDVVEAVQLTPETMKECLEWIGVENLSGAAWAPIVRIRLTGEGVNIAFAGDYIARDSAGKFYAQNGHQFQAQYEEETS